MALAGLPCGSPPKPSVQNRPTHCSTASTRKLRPTGRSVMAIPEYARANFETLVKAAKAGDLALMECSEVESGETRSEEHTSELQSLMRISYAVFCLKKKNKAIS